MWWLVRVRRAELLRACCAKQMYDLLGPVNGSRACRCDAEPSCRSSSFLSLGTSLSWPDARRLIDLAPTFLTRSVMFFGGRVRRLRRAAR